VGPLKSDDASAFARLSQELLAEPASDYTLQRVVDLAVATVAGCHYAGVTLKHNGQMDTPAASDPVVRHLDEAQYRLDEGPCVDAVRAQDTYVITNTATESRWPRWAPIAAEAGVRSVLSVRLETPRQVVGSLNLYSRTMEAFDGDARLSGHIYAMHASNAIYANSTVENLGIGMRTRHLIGMAQGMLMLRYGLDEDQAFQFLRRRSQEQNVKLRSVAENVIKELGNHTGWQHET
jgi:transcriptional regulator with GAF, ATPase, and Fis domain